MAYKFLVRLTDNTSETIEARRVEIEGDTLMLLDATAGGSIVFAASTGEWVSVKRLSED
jgi:hypothetical protein